MNLRLQLALATTGIANSKLMTAGSGCEDGDTASTIAESTITGPVSQGTTPATSPRRCPVLEEMKEKIRENNNVNEFVHRPHCDLALESDIFCDKIQYGNIGVSFKPFKLTQTLDQLCSETGGSLDKTKKLEKRLDVLTDLLYESAVQKQQELHSTTKAKTPLQEVLIHEGPDVVVAFVLGQLAKHSSQDFHFKMINERVKSANKKIPLNMKAPVGQISKTFNFQSSTDKGNTKYSLNIKTNLCLVEKDEFQSDEFPVEHFAIDVMPENSAGGLEANVAILSNKHEPSVKLTSFTESFVNELQGIRVTSGVEMNYGEVSVTISDAESKSQQHRTAVQSKGCRSTFGGLAILANRTVVSIATAVLVPPGKPTFKQE